MTIGEWIILVIAVIAIVFLIGFVIYANVKAPPKHKKTAMKEPAYFDNTRVEKKGIRSRSEGLHQPQCIVEYGVLFVTESGEEKFFLVRKEVFDDLKEGQVGTLVIINGKFFDFGHGEEMN